MISSVQNPKIKDLRSLQKSSKSRQDARAFIVEGVRLAEEAIASNWPVKSAYYTRGLDVRGQALVKSLTGKRVPVEEISENVMRAAADTQTPQGILLEVGTKELPLPEHPTLVLILDAIADPGNLGTLLRSAAAAAADAVLLAPGCVDPFSPKVLRSAMGAHFRLSLREMKWPEISTYCEQQALSVCLAEADEGDDLYKTDLTNPLAFIIGGEAQGASSEARSMASKLICIPMPGKIESLNAATSGSLLLFEALRQRREKGSA